MISVCIATHNGGKYIKKQLESILEQLAADDEIVISDDGSTDDTIAKIQSLADERIHVYSFVQPYDYSSYHLSSYYYATCNFEHALRQAKGDYIFLCDQDDVWVEGRVKRFMKALQKASYVTSNFSTIDENGVLLQERYYENNPCAHLNWFSALNRLPFRGCCSAFRREVLLQALPFPPHLFLHDCWIGLIAFKHHYTLQFLNEPLLLYRRHANNVSEMQSPNGLWFKLKYRITLLLQLLNHR